jgi:hypothetical protein
LEPEASSRFLHGQRSGGHDDGQLHAGGTQFPEQFNPAYIRHVIVGDHELIAVRLVADSIKDLPSHIAVFSGVHLVTGTPEHFGVETPDVRVVLHHENAARWTRSSLS